MRFFCSVINLQGDDREPVNDEAGSLGVQGCLEVLCACKQQEAFVDLLDQVVAKLVEAVDGVFDCGDGCVGGVGAAGGIFLMPKVIVGAVLCQNQVDKLSGLGGADAQMVPLAVRIVMCADNKRRSRERERRRECD